MAVHVALTEGSVTITIAGELDPATTPSVAVQVAQVLDGLPERLVFDLRRVGFMDCAAARLIAGTGRYLPDGARPVILAPSPAVRRILELTGLDAYCEIVALSIAARGPGRPGETRLARDR
ncbi:MAG TPA: STAS domain-containing protein [Streptosporangiaceae bacterium]